MGPPFIVIDAFLLWGLAKTMAPFTFIETDVVASLAMAHGTPLFGDTAARRLR